MIIHSSPLSQHKIRAENPIDTRLRSPSLAYYPELLQSVERLRHYPHWDDATLALLKMVAGKLHAEGQPLSPHWDNDQLLEQLGRYHCQQGEPPAYLLQFAQRAAAALEAHPEDYQAMLASRHPSEAAPAAALARHQPNGGLTGSRMLIDLARGVINRVIETLIIDAMPTQAGLCRESYEDLRSIWFGNYTPQRQLEQLRVVLARLSQQLGANSVPLKGYLDTLDPWLASVSSQWSSLAGALHGVTDSGSLLGKLVTLLAATERLLLAPGIREALDGSRLVNLGQGVGELKALLSRIQLWQGLPNEAGLADYLGILTDNSLISKLIDQSTLQLGQALAQVLSARPYPASGSLTERLEWLISTLANPRLRQQLQPHLEMVLGGKPAADQLVATCQFVAQLCQFPAAGGLGEQGRWLLSTLGQYCEETPALAWGQQCYGALAAYPEMVDLLNRLLDNSPGAWPGLMNDLGKGAAMAAATSMGPWAASQAAGYLLPANVALVLERFYRESAPTESWASLGKRLSGSVWTLIKPYLVGQLMGDPLAATTVLYAEKLQVDASWEQTLQWLITQDPGQEKVLQFVYGQYLNLILVWQIYQAVNGKEGLEAEAALRKLAAQLKEYQVVTAYPQLEKLIDLLPLLPALRQARQQVGSQPVAAGWLPWMAQWLGVLEHSHSESLQGLHGQLSRRFEKWLGEAIVSAISAVSLPMVAGAELGRVGAGGWPWLPASSAGGRGRSGEGDVVSLVAAGEPPRARAGVSGSLVAGISLEALGVAAISYGLLRMGQGDAAAQADDASGGAPLAQSLLPAGEARPVRGRGAWLWQQRVPLLLGMAAISAGGVFLYRWAVAEDQPAVIDTGDAAVAIDGVDAREEATIKDLVVPDLDFIFDIPLAEPDTHTDIARVKRSEPLTEIENSTIIHLARTENSTIPDLMLEKSSTNPSLAQAENSATTDRALLANGVIWDLKQAIHHDESIDWPTRNEFDLILRRADRAPDVQAAETEQEKYIRQLIKCIQLTSALLEERAGQQGADHADGAAQKLLTALWHIADNLSDDYSKTIVEQYKRAYPHQRSSMLMTNLVPSADIAYIKAQFSRLGEHSLERIEQLYKPILNPSMFIEEHIRQGIMGIEQRSGESTGLQPDSRIKVELYPKVHPNPNLHGSAPQSSSHSFTLMEIVTGQYLYEIKQLRDANGRQYRITGMDYQAQINELTQVDLQAVMEQALADYRADPVNQTGLTLFYQEMINIRCLAYLDQPHPVPRYAEAVQRFLSGKVQAQLISFHDVHLNGLFFIPANGAAGIIFSVDEASYFHIGDYQHEYWENTEKFTTLSLFPNTSEFRGFVFNKMPSYQKIKYEGDSKAFRYQVMTSIFMPSISYQHVIAKVVGKPFAFAASENRVQLADKLFDGLMSRLASDIDTLVFSSFEHITEEALEIIKQILNIGSIVLVAAIPGTGSLLGRFTLFMASLALDAIYVGASASQAYLSDRPERVEAFRDEAILVGILGGLGAITGGAPLLTGAANQLYSVRNISRALSLYQQVKQMGRQLIPTIFSDINWRRLVDSNKIKLLVKTMQLSDQASALTQLSSTSAVQQSIRHNLLLDLGGQPRHLFHWGTFASEQARVRHLLEADLVRLNHANMLMTQQLSQLIDAPGPARFGGEVLGAIGWIIDSYHGDNTGGNFMILVTRVRGILKRYQGADLLDMATLNHIHQELVLPASGGALTVFRASSDAVSMGSDIAQSGLEKALSKISTMNITDQEVLADALFAAIDLYRPFVVGNGCAARMAYILATQFDAGTALSKVAEPHRMAAIFANTVNEPFDEIIESFVKNSEITNEVNVFKCANRGKRGLSLSKLCSSVEVDTSPQVIAPYSRREDNVVGVGSIGVVYNYDETKVVKEYMGVMRKSYKRRLKDAMNNGAAMNRLYGPDTAHVLLLATGNDNEKKVALVMKRIAGNSLDHILSSGHGIEEVLAAFAEKNVSEALANKLASNGIYHQDLNLGNVMFDRVSHEFNIVDFDLCSLRPKTEMIHPGQVESMALKLAHDFNEFRRQAPMSILSRPTR